MNESFEQALEEFEQEFNQGNQPDICDFLQSQDSENEEFLSELVHTELELRLRDGQAARVECYVKRFPDLAQDPSVLLDWVRTEYTTRRNFDPACRLEEFVIRFPDLRQSLVDELLGSSIDFREGDTKISTQQQRNIPKMTASHSDLAARFRKQKLHEQGGLGNIWLAKDQEFERKVVLKEIKSKYSNSPPHHARFARESKIMSRLEHPGIVPVYGQGSSLDGIPFIAMQFIQGRTLLNSIREYHQEKSKKTSFNPSKSLTFNRLLQHFVDACDTIEYAHNQQVIHRDIKPSNIMIGQFGETYLIDWGLACKLNSQDDENASLSADDLEEHLADPMLSVDGQVIGSPAYMSPEQSAGNKQWFNRSTDVYGLGATLLTLVTGCENPNRELEALNSDNPDHSNLRVHAVHRPLLSICQKAMAKDPQQRYSSVNELREDIENYLIDKPIEAHPESILDRLNRFLRQNRTLLNSAIVSLALVSLVSLLAALWIDQERQSAVAARESESKLKQKESTARQRAEQRTEQLTNVIGIFSDVVSGTDDAGLRMLQESRTAEQIVDELESRITQNDDPITQAFLSTVVARSNRASADYKKATQTYRNAIEILDNEGIEVTDPLYADLLIGLTKTLLATGDMDEAETHLNTLKLAYQDNPEQLAEIYFRSLLASAKLAIRKIDLEVALSHVNEARQLGQELYADTPNHINSIWADYVLADVHFRRGEIAEALPLFNSVLDALNEKQILHGTGIAAAVRLSEFYQARDPKKSFALIEKTRKDAAQLFGPDHADTMRVDARYGRMLVKSDDKTSRLQGIEILERCYEIQLNRLGAANRESVDTTLLLTQSLLSFEDKSKIRQAIEILENTIESLNTPSASKKFAGFIASFYHELANAYSKIGNRELAGDAMTKSVSLAVKEYGQESKITKWLQIKLDKILSDK